MAKLTDTEIAIRICPKRLRWPAPGTNITWAKAHACVDAFHDVIRQVDLGCLEAEQSRELSPGDVARRRAELCDQALRRLVNFPAFELAEKALSENIVALERLSARDSEQAQMLQQLTQALPDLQEGVAATRRMVLDRCKMRESASV